MQGMGTSSSSRPKSLPKGFVAGLIGGIVGAGAMLVAEEIFPPRPHSEPAPLAVLARRTQRAAPAETPAAPRESQAAPSKTQAAPPSTAPPGWQALHWAFAALAGGVFGMASEVEPSLAAWRGAAFGVTLNRITHESLLPRLGLAPPRDQQSTQTRVSSWISHAAYGVATDSVRRVLRRLL